MLSRKIIASNIRNLTDARYFAAWMVDYMSFDISANTQSFIGPSNITEIINWLEGPAFIGNFSDHLNLEFLVENVKQLNLRGIITNHKEIAEQWNFENGELFYSVTDFELVKNLDTKIITKPSSVESFINAGHEVYIDSRYFELELLESLGKRTGLCLEGGEEIKTGLKNFDELDDILEFLAD